MSETRFDSASSIALTCVASNCGSHRSPAGIVGLAIGSQYLS